MSQQERHILILDGHPDSAPNRFVHALADAYEQGAREAKHEVMKIRVADLDVPLLRTKSEYEKGRIPDDVFRCQDAMEWATHVVILYPLWVGSAPALLKALLEQIVRPGFAFATNRLGHWPIKYLHGRSASVVVTMGMSALAYRLRFGFRASRVLQTSALSICGFRPVRTTMIGQAENMSLDRREMWLAKMRTAGQRAQ